MCKTHWFSVDFDDLQMVFPIYVSLPYPFLSGSETEQFAVCPYACRCWLLWGFFLCQFRHTQRVMAHLKLALVHSGYLRLCKLHHGRCFETCWPRRGGSGKHFTYPLVIEHVLMETPHVICSWFDGCPVAPLKCPFISGMSQLAVLAMFDWG